ncbi:TonB-dependent receptor [Spirosoma agri]|uniref:TonB-dependent receptor n=1 Tax=Spirosoma agri TaxID=1987381 RepID=A0A6M0IJC7_9BACT|nr:TonB-dependent receptor [Spirosoma agri]NEU68379.1 TonB-dependent receptor [Spirosoma agri]
MKNFLWSLCIVFISSIPIVKSQTPGSLSGSVTDQQSLGISGAYVHLLNTNLGAPTDNQGKFSIPNVPSGQYTLAISALGFATTVKSVTLTVENPALTITLVEAARRLDEVTVSAQKVEEDPQKLPFSVSTLSSKQVQEYRLWTSKDLTALIPNLYSANPGDGRNVTSVRGIATTSYDPTIATYIDGVNQFSLDTYVTQLLDIERIEVLRGPQGTLYGRNAMGGVINIITKQPDNKTRGFVELNYGNYGQQRYSAGLRTPLVKDRLFLGVSALYGQQAGFYRNAFTQSSFDRANYVMGNYYLKFLASPRWSLTLNVKHNTNRNDGTFPLASSPQDALSEPFTVNQNAVGRLIDQVINTSLSANYAGKGFTFTSQTAYQSNYRYYTQPLDGDFSPIDGVTIVVDYGRKWNNMRVGTQEFRFTSPASSTSRFNWIAGTYGFYQDNPVKQGTHFGNDADLVGAPFPNFTSINTNKGTSFGVAGYGQGTYAINPRLKLTLGLRYDYEHKKQSVLGEFQQDGDVAMVTQPDTSATATFTAISPKASLAYQWTENHQVYGTYSRGYRAGGITQLSSDPSQPPLYAYKPEYSNNVEIGVKNTFWNNQLRVNVAAFYTQVQDAQVPTLVLPDAITITRNAGQLTSRGVELEVQATPAKGLELTYQLGYTKATYGSLNLASNGETVNLKGNRQLFTPDVTSMLAVQYSYALGGAQQFRLIARGEWSYLGKQYFDLANQISQQGYGLFNTRLGISSRHADLFFWGRNLSNETFIDYAYNFGAAHLGNPRTYGTTLRVNF